MLVQTLNRMSLFSEISRAIPAQQPAFIIDKVQLSRNLEKLYSIRSNTDCKILISLKAFACFHLFPLIFNYLDGVSASSLYEARLGWEYLGKNVHTYSPCFNTTEFTEICSYSNHLIFNSLSQFSLYQKHLKNIKNIGIRLNVETSVSQTLLYDPSLQFSRFGITKAELSNHVIPDAINGIHLHNLCGGQAEDLEITVKSLEQKFGYLLERMQWLNLGGGHLITDPNYNTAALVKIIKRLQEKYNLQVYLEPGEAVVNNCGFLMAHVGDVIRNQKKIALLNVSPSVHVPDVLEMPLRLDVVGADFPGKQPYNYILGGNSCLSGDVFGEYSFADPLFIGDTVIFENVAAYTMVKTTFFNGIQHPALIILHDKANFEVVRQFTFHDYKKRLG